jgi:hypothetical protein
MSTIRHWHLFTPSQDRENVVIEPFAYETETLRLVMEPL